MKKFLVLSSLLLLAITAMSFTPEPPDPVKNRFTELFAQADGAFIASGLELVSPANASLEVAAVDKFSYGYRKAVTLTNAASITLDPSNTTLTYAIVSIAQATTINAINTKSVVGDVIYLQVTADGTNRVLTFTGNMVGVAYTVTASKQVLLEFIYNGSKFVNASVIQVT